MAGTIIEFKWKTGTIAGLLGPSGCGKSVFCLNFIDNIDKILEQPTKNIIYVYKIWQDIFTEFQNRNPHVIFTTNIFDIDSQRDSTEHLFCIVDDFFPEISTRNSPEQKLIERFSVISCHHKNTSILLHLQNPFFSNGTPINRNLNMLIIYKSHRDSSFILTLQRQIFVGDSTLKEAYNNVVSKYKPLFVYLHPSQSFSFCTNTLIPGPNTEIYLPDKFVFPEI